MTDVHDSARRITLALPRSASEETRRTYEHWHSLEVAAQIAIEVATEHMTPAEIHEWATRVEQAGIEFKSDNSARLRENIADLANELHDMAIAAEKRESQS